MLVFELTPTASSPIQIATFPSYYVNNWFSTNSCSLIRTYMRCTGVALINDTPFASSLPWVLYHVLVWNNNVCLIKLSAMCMQHWCRSHSQQILTIIEEVGVFKLDSCDEMLSKKQQPPSWKRNSQHFYIICGWQKMSCWFFKARNPHIYNW